MTADWKERGETTNRFWLQLLWGVCRVLGRDATRWTLLVVITVIYYVADRNARHHSREYLRRVGLPDHQWQVFCHLFAFATVTMDRLFVLGNRADIFEVELTGERLFDDLPEGAVLITSHFGSFDIMRVLARDLRDLDVRILLDVDHNPQTLEVIRNLNPELAGKIIDAGRPGPELVVRLADELRAGHLLGIMADRVLPGQAQTEVSFMGGRAAFPIGPWVLAAVLKTPVILCFGTFQGGRRYRLEFLKLDLASFPGRSRQKAVAAAQHYADVLSGQVEKAPLNWFNFYSFWTDDTP